MKLIRIMIFFFNKGHVGAQDIPVKGLLLIMLL